MSSQAPSNAISNRGSRGSKGKRGNRGRGGNQKGGHPKATGSAAEGTTHSRNDEDKMIGEKAEEKSTVEQNATEKIAETNDASDEHVCWICAEPVKFWSVPECNHRICYVCAVRLRALYKKTDCTFCKEPQSSVIFTVSPDNEFSSYSPEDIPYKDAKLSIYFETQEMMEDSLLLLKFNCPDPNCDYIGNGWGDLKLHARASHGKLMCDLCIRHKKVFAHEHALYSPNVLPVHLPSMHHRHVRQIPKEKVEGGVHPICEFCQDCFFGVDEHYSHMRETHEECFICKRNGVQFKYFQNYNSLEKHFNTDHHPCTKPECLARKFVVFNTLLDLQAHMMEEHGADMSAKDKKDVRRVQADFQFQEVARQSTRRGGAREQQREPPPPARPSPSQALSGHTTGPQPPGTSGRRAAFGSTLTNVDDYPSLTTNTNIRTPPAEPSRSSSPLVPDIEPAVAERHTALIARLQSFAGNPANAVPAVKAAIRGYRASESSARDLISTIFNVLDGSLEHTASIVNGLVDLLDEEEKKQDLLASWRGFALEQRRQFPDLVPHAVGSEYAGITSGRVLNVKNATTSRLHQPSRQVWDRVAAAASSSTQSFPPTQRRVERFPALPGTSSVSTPAFRQPTRTTPWSASAAAGRGAPTGAVVEPRSVPGPKAPQSKQSRPPKLDNDVFPELPSSSGSKKLKVSGNVSLKNILGNGAPSTSVWGPSGDGSGSAGASVPSEAVAEGVGGEEASNKSGVKGKKGKGKQKQTLFTLGTFPSS